MECPACGYVPKEGEGDGVSCPDCHVFYHKVLQRQLRELESKQNAALSANAPKKQVAMPAATTKVGRSGWFTAQMIFLGLVFVIFMVQCSSGGRSSSSNQARPADSAEMREIKMHRVARDNVNARLKDSDSAQFRNQFIGKAGTPCGEVNAKNSFGGYTGYKRFVASGGGLAVLEDDMAPDQFEETWRQLCR